MRLSIVLLLLAVASNAPLRSEPCSGADAALDTLLEGQALQGWLEASRSTDVLAEEVLATLATGLGDPRAEVAGACALALRRSGDAAIPLLTRALADARASVRLYPGKAPAGIGRQVPEALPAPVTILREEPVPQQIEALPVLANRDSQTIESSMPTLPPLRAVPAVSCETDRLLIGRGDRSARRAALSVLLDAVESADEGDACAAEAPADLSAIGDAADVVPILVDALRQQVKGMCPHPTANDELEAIGAPAVPALVSLLREFDVGSYWILPSLDRMGADALEAARPVFLEWLVSEFQGRRLDAAIRLARMPLDGPTRVRVASVFEEMLSAAPPALRLESAEGLLRMGRAEVPGVEPALVDLLNHPSDEIRARAHAALAEMRFPHPAGP